VNKDRRRVAAVVAVVLAAATATAGCGKKAGTDEAKTVDAKSTSTSTSSTSTTATGEAPTSTTTAAGSKAKAPTTTVKASGSGGSSSATTGAGAGASSAASGSGATSASAVGAKPGSYTFDISGTRSGGTPPTTAPMSAKATIVYDAASGATQHSTQSDSSGQGGGQELLLEYRADGVYIQDLKLTGQLNKEFKPSPPVLATPIPLPAGKQWSWDMTSTDGTTTIHADNKGAGTETVTIGGQAVETDKLDVVLTIKTTFNGAPITVTVTSTRWQSTKYSLIVKTHDVTDVPGFGHSDTTSVLESVNPA
jgi:hypothetical protein